MQLNETVISYSRLSKDDPKTDESQSIHNQKRLIRQYLKENPEFHGCHMIELSDDGYSGTNMERPGIQEALQLIREGRAACLLVKDVSRFSRDYIDIGRYLERIFPFMGVRFISINDNYDSKDHTVTALELDMKFKSIMADFYCKDTSDKITSQLNAKKEKGLFIAGSTPFGYQKSTNDKYKLVVAPEEAGIVRKIYAMALEGKTTSMIARDLNDREVPTPLMFEQRRRKIARQAKGEKFTWTSKTVHNILTNEVYIGTMVYGKYQQKSVGSKKKIMLPSSQWKRIYHNHEPIIEEDVFDKVQEKYRSGVNMQSRGKKEEKTDYPLLNVLYCGQCHRKLQIGSGRTHKKRIYCQYARDVSNSHCYHGNNDYREIELIVLMQFKNKLRHNLRTPYVSLSEERLAESRLSAFEKKAASLNEEIKALDREIRDQLVMMHHRTVSEVDFVEEKTRLTIMQNGYREELAECQKQITALENNLSISRECREILSAYGDISSFTPEIVKQFIERIFLYEGKRMEIEWKKDVTTVSHDVFSISDVI